MDFASPKCQVPGDQAAVRSRKVRYRGPAKNTARLQVMFTPGNVRMARRQLLAVQA